MPLNWYLFALCGLCILLQTLFYYQVLTNRLWYAKMSFVVRIPWYICGSGSVVERHLAKVNVASSNLVFRSKDAFNASFILIINPIYIRRYSQVVRQRPAKPSPPVQIRVAPPNKNRNFDTKLRFCFFTRKAWNIGIFVKRKSAAT